MEDWDGVGFAAVDGDIMIAIGEVGVEPSTTE